MPRLRRADCSGPGIARRRNGRGWVYLEPDGTRIKDPEAIARLGGLGIPPAWRDVWICPHPNGHLLATGIDAAGRKQYLYHPDWRTRRDQQKFDEMAGFARSLPTLRDHVEAVLEAGEELSRERVLACAVRLLDRGFFRIGSEDYAARNESFGLATMRKDHVCVRRDGLMVFDYRAKHGKRQVQAIADPASCVIVSRLRRRRSGGPELLAYRDGRSWVDIRSPDINAYIKEITGGDYSAKDFRTWSATVLCAVGLAVSGEAHGSKTSRRRAINRAVAEVARYLGNTPAVCRSSYIDPRVIDAYEGGLTIEPALHEVLGEAEPGELAIHQRVVEEGVLDLINERASSPALAQVA
jgi:DNA topoisomerase IB